VSSAASQIHNTAITVLPACPSPDLFWAIRGQANRPARMVLSQKVNWFVLYQSADKMASIFLGLGKI
jgi:hypothetical protein